MNAKHARVFRRYFEWAGITRSREQRQITASFQFASAATKAKAIQRLEEAMAKDPRPLPPAKKAGR